MIDRRPVDRRAIRKRGLLREIGADLAAARARADGETGSRLRRLNLLAATAFALGGSLFAIGAGLAQAGAAVDLYCSVYLLGGICFSTGGYASLLQVINGPRDLGAEGVLSTGRWRWWSREPERLDWASAAILFLGTLVFAVNIVDSFLEGLSARGANRLIWSPDMIGCALFLISGHLAMVEMGGWLRRPRDLGWRIVLVNQLGSVLFMVAAVASFVRPSTGAELAIGVANWGTIAGALCFALGGVLQEFERPPD